MYLLGIDIGSSSVKVSLLDKETGITVASAFSPDVEMVITAHKPGWAEQDPNVWVKNAIESLRKIKENSNVDLMQVEAIGISYQMHGLVVVDKQGKVLRPSIIWCDSRAVEIGNGAYAELGEEYCLNNLLNSPGNFTASKLKWVQENEPDLYKKIYKIMLPGDYLAFRLTGEIKTTQSGLSEGVMWDFEDKKVANKLLDFYNINKELLPDVVDTFSNQGIVTKKATKEFGLPVGIPVSYRAGDQPNNAFSLNVLNPGEIAATAGTSAVVYGVTDQKKYDSKSRVNTFLHVNNSDKEQRLGVLLCLNSAGILNSWLRKNIVADGMSYEEMNKMAAESSIGSNGLLFYPFGNGAERVLENKNIGGSLEGFNFNIHTQSDVLRAAQEGIVFALVYGIGVMKQSGIDAKVIKAGKANMFLSQIFRDTLAGTTNSVIELYNTDGAEGAARGAGVGAGLFKSFDEAFKALKIVDTIKILEHQQIKYKEAYVKWKIGLENMLKDIRK